MIGIRKIHFLIFIALFAGQAQADTPSLDVDQKQEIAQKVYDRIVQSIGDSRPAPALRLRSRVQVAVYWPDRREIDLDEKAFDLCTSMPDGNSALAVLLGHELAHYYDHDGWTREFGNAAPADLSTPLRILSDKDRLGCEMQADYFGGFYGYQAGFNTLGVAPRLIPVIYQHYDRMVGYPTEQEREDIATQAQAKLEQLIPVFNAANMLIVLRQYATASLCYDRIARDFPSREILNNAGVARAQLALTMKNFSAEDKRFFYPFEFDADTRLRFAGLTSRGDDVETRRLVARLLSQAARCFEEAKAKDPAYAPAYLNLAGVYDLQNEPELAAAFADKAIAVAGQSNEPLTMANARIVRGIVLAHSGKTTDAADIFRAVQQVQPRLASANLDALTGKTPHVDITPSTQPAATETIAGQSAETDDVLDNAPYQTVKISSSDADDSDITIQHKQTGDWQGVRIQTDDLKISLFSTTPVYTGKTSQGISLGSTLDEVESDYGSPSDVTAGRQCTYYRFDHGGVIFQIDAGQKVTGWTIFAIKVN